MSRHDVLFVSWVRHHARSADLAAALGAEPVFVSVGRKGSLVSLPFRWSVQAVRTAWLVARRRPRVLIVMAPPLPLVVLAVAYALLTRRPVVLDAHTGAVRRTRRQGALNTPFVRLARRADLTIVTNEPLARLLGLGVRTTVLHDPPVTTTVPPNRSRTTGHVLFPCDWAPDEPLAALADAARQLPEVRFVITGRQRGPAATIDFPRNVLCTGWLSQEDFTAQLVGSAAVLALTTRDFTMQRAGYEALAATRPLVASDTAALRSYFTAGTVFAPAEPSALAAAIRVCLRESDRLEREMASLREEKTREFSNALEDVRSVIEAGGRPTGGQP